MCVSDGTQAVALGVRGASLKDIEYSDPLADFSSEQVPEQVPKLHRQLAQRGQGRSRPEQVHPVRVARFRAELCLGLLELVFPSWPQHGFHVPDVRRIA
jgi:hypothetical protein